MCSVALPGCLVKVYQPVSGLHRPVALDPQHPNFSDTRLNLHCARGKLLNDARAGALCEKVTTLFENQGAEVVVTVGAEPAAAAAAPTARTALTMELTARESDESKHPLSWVLFAASFTVLPGLVERSFEQEMVIRDASGFLLASDTLEGRLVRRYGFGPWLSNTLLDLARKKSEKLGNDAAARDLSNDLYGQLSQQLFNAKMHAQVLQQATPVGRSETGASVVVPR